MAQMADLLLINGTVLTMNSGFDQFLPGAVAIQDDLIVDVGPAERLLKDWEAREVVDCTGQAIIPGLVNGHTHVPMNLLRGLADDLRLDVWLLGYMMPVEREFVKPEFIRLGTRLACAEMILSGVTCFADMYYFEEYVAGAAVDAGMRAICAETILKYPTPDAFSYEEALRKCQDFIEHWQGSPLITPSIAPHSHYTSTPEILKSCVEIAKNYNVPLITHVSETAQEAETCLQEHAMPVVHWLYENGVLDTTLVAAHCVHITESEKQLLKNAGAGIIHNPTSNLKLASGIAPVDRMLKMGLTLGIGTDGAASNNDLDFFDEVRLAALLAKGASGDPTAMPAKQAFRLATIGGAEALHLDEQIGSLQVGKKADLAVVDLNGVHNTPTFSRDPNAIYAQLVYAVKSTDVSHVLVNGRWLLRDRVLQTLDIGEIRAESQEIAGHIDLFLIQREKSVLSKLLVIGGVKQEESFEVQVKGVLGQNAFDQVRSALADPAVTITKRSHYYQFDSYFIFSDPNSAEDRLRFREDQVVDDSGNVVDARNRLTLIGPSSEREFPGAVMLSRSRYIAPADKSLRFYQEYFQPNQVQQIDKDRQRWRIRYKNTNFAINLDRLTKPNIDHYFVEVKSRTWSERDAERKAALIIELMALLEKFGTVRPFPEEYINLLPA